MCLNLKGSQYRSIDEVENLLENGYNMTEEKILAMKDDRDEIEKQIRIIDQWAEIEAWGI